MFSIFIIVQTPFFCQLKVIGERKFMNNTYLMNSELLQYDLSKAAYKVAQFLIASQGWRTGISWKSRITLAIGTGYSVSTIKRATKELVEKGLLIIKFRFTTKNDQTSNSYQIILPAGSNKKIQGDYDTLATLNGTQLKVYQYIKFCVGKGESSHMSQKNIAKACCISVSTLYRTLKVLVASNLIHSGQTQDPQLGTIWNAYSLVTAPFTENTIQNENKDMTSKKIILTKSDKKKQLLKFVFNSLLVKKYKPLPLRHFMNLPPLQKRAPNNSYIKATYKLEKENRVLCKILKWNIFKRVHSENVFKSSVFCSTRGNSAFQCHRELQITHDDF